MNKKSKVMMLLIAIVLVLLNVSCVRHVITEQTMPPTEQTMTPTEQTMTPEEKKILQRWAFKELGKASQPFCWRNTYGRGVGGPVNTCPEGQEKDAGLCYPTCEDIGKKGWIGVGPVCWPGCPPGFRDDGAYCFKLSPPYGRGVGFPWKFGDKLFSLAGAARRCENKHGKGQCEKHLLIYYPKCKPKYRAHGCCLCSPRCPPDMTDIGISCQKNSKGRGVGKPMKCREGQDYDAGLCYTPCKENYHGLGPVCWQDCPDTQPVNCAAGCATDSSQCAEKTTAQVLAPLEVALDVAMAVTTGGSANAAVTAAKASAKTAVKTAGKAAAKETLKNLTKRIAAEMMQGIRAKLNKKILKKYSKEIAEDVYSNVAENLALASLEDDFDTKDFLMLFDPTGIAALTEAYVQPMCGFDEDPPTFGK